MQIPIFSLSRAVFRSVLPRVKKTRPGSRECVPHCHDNWRYIVTRVYIVIRFTVHQIQQQLLYKTRESNCGGEVISNTNWIFFLFSFPPSLNTLARCQESSPPPVYICANINSGFENRTRNFQHTIILYLRITTFSSTNLLLRYYHSMWLRVTAIFGAFLSSAWVGNGWRSKDQQQVGGVHFEMSSHFIIVRHKLHIDASSLNFALISTWLEKLN